MAKLNPENVGMMVSLNDVVDLIANLSSGKLKDLINPAATVADCTGLCDCNVRYCSCHGSVSNLSAGDLVSFPDYLELRANRIKTLKESLELLDVPKELNEFRNRD